MTPPSWTLRPIEADLATLVADGALAPLDGVLTAGQLATVRERGQLPDGTPWRGEVTLSVDPGVAAAAAEAGQLVLCDEDGTVLATLTVSDLPGEHAAKVVVGGPLRAVARPAPLAFPDLHRTPAEARQELAGRAPITVVQPTTVPDVGALERWRHHLDVQGGGLLVQPLLASMPAERWASTVRAHQAALTHLGGDRAVLQLLPLPRDEDLVDAATLRAVVAANHGARWLLDASGADPAVLEALQLDARPLPVVPSGPWHADVRAELEHATERERGVAVLLTGLSGSGKSTIARALRARLLEQGATVTLLDGDLVRRTLSAGLGFSAEDRATNVRRIGWVAAEIARHGGVAICAPIAPEDRVRRAVRDDVTAAGGRFVLVHVATALEVCEQRDVKGLYARARAGDLEGLTGVDAPYEPPGDAEVVVDTAGVSVATAVDRILAAVAAPRPDRDAGS